MISRFLRLLRLLKTRGIRYFLVSILSAFPLTPKLNSKIANLIVRSAIRTSHFFIYLSGVHTSQLWSERRKSLEFSLRRLESGRSVLAIEVGTWFAAGSTEVIARSLPAGSRLFCIDLWKPYVNPEESVSSAKNMNEVSLIAHLSAIKNIRRIEKKYPSIEISILQGKSEELLNLFESGSADFIYLDGSHYYKDFKLDLEIASKILNPATGVLCGDDCELEPNLDLYEKCKPYENLDLVRLPSGEWVHPGVVIALFESGFRVRVREGHWMRI